MEKEIVCWVILAKGDIDEWRPVESGSFFSCGLGRHKIVLVNGKQKVGSVPENMFSNGGVTYRCWVHFGGDQKVLAFDQTSWQARLNEIFKKKSGVNNTPQGFMLTDFAPYTQDGRKVAWQQVFWNLREQIRNALGASEVTPSKTEQLHNDLEACWQGAMTYREQALREKELHDLMPVAIYFDGLFYAHDHAQDKIEEMRALIRMDVPDIAKEISNSSLGDEGAKYVEALKALSTASSDDVDLLGDAFMHWFRSACEERDSTDGGERKGSA